MSPVNSWRSRTTWLNVSNAARSSLASRCSSVSPALCRCSRRSPLTLSLTSRPRITFSGKLLEADESPPPAERPRPCTSKSSGSRPANDLTAVRDEHVHADRLDARRERRLLCRRSERRAEERGDPESGLHRDSLAIDSVQRRQQSLRGRAPATCSSSTTDRPRAVARLD